MSTTLFDTCIMALGVGFTTYAVYKLEGARLIIADLKTADKPNQEAKSGIAVIFEHDEALKRLKHLEATGASVEVVQLQKEHIRRLAKRAFDFNKEQEAEPLSLDSFKKKSLSKWFGSPHAIVVKIGHTYWTKCKRQYLMNNAIYRIWSALIYQYGSVWKAVKYGLRMVRC